MLTIQWLRLTAACAVLVALMGGIIACGGGGDDSPEQTISKAVSTMNGLDSYEMEIAFTPFGVPIASLVGFDGGDYFERIPADLAAKGGVEYVYAEGSVFKRDCTGPEVCTQWLRTEGQPLIPSLGGTVSSVPETLGVVSVELATGWTLVTGTSEVKFSGSVSLHGAVEENQRRAFLAAGNTPEDVEAGLLQLEDSRPPEGVSQIDVTLSSDNKYITHVTLSAPDQRDNPYVDYSYSKFNAVQVAAPAAFIN